MEADKSSRELLNQAHALAEESRHEFTTPEHLLLVMLKDLDIIDVLISCGANRHAIRADLEDYLEEKVPKIPEGIEGRTDFSDGLNTIFMNATAQCLNAEKSQIAKYDLLVSMLDVTQLYCSYILRKNGVKRLPLIEAVSSARNEEKISEPDSDGRKNRSPIPSNNDDDRFDLGDDDCDDPDIFDDDEDFDEDFDEDDDKTRDRINQRFLKRYTTDLTEKARNGELDALVGRKEEIERTIEILGRRKKNNPLHVGEPGVGKTAITEGLASMIAAGNVPDVLRGCSVFSLDMGSLVTGTKFRGEFEERIRRVVDAISSLEKAIIFIDEIHTLVGAGAVSGGSLDAANMLKPVLGSGKIRCIGSTTFSEYSKYFEKDSALSRRFQKIDILEPSRDESVEILRGLSPKYESYHQVKYSDEILEEIVDLAVQYLPDRRLPDKAIDIMDESGSFAKIHLGDAEKKEPLEIKSDVVRKITSRMARIPLEKITEDESVMLRNLEKSLGEKVLGQNRAVKAVSIAVKKARAGFRNEERPEGAFLFVGPTGVGKTELARSLASQLGENLIRFDMSEYQEKHTVSRLIGSPPGYVGYENGGLLVDAVRNAPHSIVLFDEIEKAHQDIFNVLLQVMDYGTLTDSQGRRADFRSCILIMTSNAGARDMEKGSVGFSGSVSAVDGNDDATLNHAVEEAFSPEFRNRLDAVIPFSHLDSEVILSIARTAVEKIAKRLETRGVKMEASEDAVRVIADKGYSREFGARNIYRTAESEIASPLVDEVLFGKLCGGSSVRVDAQDGKICFEFGASE